MESRTVEIRIEHDQSGLCGDCGLLGERERTESDENGMVDFIIWHECGMFGDLDEDESFLPLRDLTCMLCQVGNSIVIRRKVAHESDGVYCEKCDALESGIYCRFFDVTVDDESGEAKRANVCLESEVS